MATTSDQKHGHKSEFHLALFKKTPTTPTCLTSETGAETNKKGYRFHLLLV